MYSFQLPFFLTFSIDSTNTVSVQPESDVRLNGGKLRKCIKRLKEDKGM